MLTNMYFYYLCGVVSFTFLPIGGHLAALLFVAIAVFLFMTLRTPLMPIPPITLVSVAYLMGFTLVVLFPNLYTSLWMKVPQHAIDIAILWTTRAFGAFAVGYVVFSYLIKFINKNKNNEEENYKQRVKYTLYFLTVIGCMAVVAIIVKLALYGFGLVFIEGVAVDSKSGQGTLAQVLHLLTWLRYPFFFMFLLFFWGKKKDKFIAFLFLILIVLSALEIISIGSKAAIIRLLIVLVLPLTFLPTKFTVKQVLIGAVSVLIIYGSFAVITEYRKIMKDELKFGSEVFSFSVQMRSFRTAVVSSLPFSEASSQRDTEIDHEVVLGRFGSGIYSFANLLMFTNHQPPYENSVESFLTPFYSFAPRFLLPEKPVFFHSGRYAREFFGWSYGGVSVTLLGSLYFSWGYAGIIGGMAFLGGLLGALASQIKVSLNSPAQSGVLYIILFLDLLEVGATFHAIFTNFIRVFILLLILKAVYPLVPIFFQRRQTAISCFRFYKAT